MKFLDNYSSDSSNNRSELIESQISFEIANSNSKNKTFSSDNYNSNSRFMTSECSGNLSSSISSNNTNNNSKYISALYKNDLSKMSSNVNVTRIAQSFEIDDTSTAANVKDPLEFQKLISERRCKCYIHFFLFSNISYK
jgi:hypothetical protein